MLILFGNIHITVNLLLVLFNKMISLCSVIIAGDDKFLLQMLISLHRMSKLINEAIIVDLYGEEYERKYFVGGIKVFQFGYTPKYNYNRSFGWHDYGHALGLHFCIEKTSNEYNLTRSRYILSN